MAYGLQPKDSGNEFWSGGQLLVLCCCASRTGLCRFVDFVLHSALRLDILHVL